jgi:hypothetical protein
MSLKSVCGAMLEAVSADLKCPPIFDTPDNPTNPGEKHP